MEVLNVLKPGLSEKACENSLVIELRKRGHEVEQQRRFEVRYAGQVVDTLIPDLIFDGIIIIVDTKVVTEFNDSHIAQMIGYLGICDLKPALLINFKFASPKWKRVLR